MSVANSKARGKRYVRDDQTNRKSVRGLNHERNTRMGALFFVFGHISVAAISSLIKMPDE